MTKRTNRPSPDIGTGNPRVFWFSDPSFLDEVKHLLSRTDLSKSNTADTAQQTTEPDVSGPHSRSH